MVESSILERVLNRYPTVIIHKGMIPKVICTAKLLFIYSRVAFS